MPYMAYMLFFFRGFLGRKSVSRYQCVSPSKRKPYSPLRSFQQVFRIFKIFLKKLKKKSILHQICFHHTCCVGVTGLHSNTAGGYTEMLLDEYFLRLHTTKLVMQVFMAHLSDNYRNQIIIKASSEINLNPEYWDSPTTMKLQLILLY